MALIGTLSMAAYGQAMSPSVGTASASDSLLAREVVIPISTVRRFFPQVDQEARTGPHLTAVGAPKATRSVIYANSNSSKKVTITVDQYVSSSDASSAYEEAVRKSKAVPGFTPISAPNLGENAFIATVTRGEETHIGFGALHGNLILGITVVGYHPTPGTIVKLMSLAREEKAAAKVP
ncbi:MAG TPA: hypothetical protein VGM66_04730 [Candidatus Udaeobacter sp.]|jgi:hypothetical protein